MTVTMPTASAEAAAGSDAAEATPTMPEVSFDTSPEGVTGTGGSRSTARSRP